MNTTKTGIFNLIAFYLPQFYPTAENDEWWGKGFTEWTNVVKARPRFKGHYQPHLPADLGFYDLRLPETMHEQIKLAKEYNIHGFCFYHYWFNGKRILEKPVQNYFRDKNLDFPFMLCWANQNWTRIWDGGERHILLEQNYNHDDDRDHIKELINFFQDNRYIKVDGKPVLVVYRTELMPDPGRTSEIWREEVRKAGFEDIYLIRIENQIGGINPENIGFDATLDFHPNPRNLPMNFKSSLINKIYRWRPISKIWYKSRMHKLLNNEPTSYIWNYEDYVTQNIYKPPREYKRYPSLFPMWDNSSRRARGAWIFHDSRPKSFKKWLLKTIDSFEPYTKDENFIFINAWNEWAEGAHLEPCQNWGKQYLEVIRGLNQES